MTMARLKLVDFPLMTSCGHPFSYFIPTRSLIHGLQSDVSYTPTLRILNSKNKTMRIWREGVVDGVIVNPGATEALRHNDRVDIVSGLPLVYVPAGAPFPINAII
jgi:hypothetical protein